jgi:hypothetical protein
VCKIEQIYLSVCDKEGPQLTQTERMTQMMTEEKSESLPIYTTWLGKPVVLLIQIRQGRVPIPCSIIGESNADLRVLLHAWMAAHRRRVMVCGTIDFVDRSRKLAIRVKCKTENVLGAFWPERILINSFCFIGAVAVD